MKLRNPARLHFISNFGSQNLNNSTGELLCGISCKRIPCVYRVDFANTERPKGCEKDHSTEIIEYPSTKERFLRTALLIFVQFLRTNDLFDYLDYSLSGIGEPSGKVGEVFW
jgi:hypothetical protein